jgi:hypothetical protein
MSSRVARSALALALAAVGCAPRISYDVIQSGTLARAPAKPVDCPMLFLRTGSSRPYDEMPAITVTGYGQPCEGMQRALGGRACELGADAVVVTGECRSVEGAVSMTGVAIKFRDEAAR